MFARLTFRNHTLSISRMCHSVVMVLLFNTLLSAEESKTSATAPDFTARDLNGKKIRLKETLQRGPVLIDFWALWCIPCLKALPHLQKIRDRYHERGLTVIAVNQDSPSDQSKVKPFVKRKRYRFQVIFDEDKDLWYRFKVIALPTTLLLDTDGNIVYSHTGHKPGDEAELIAQIERLLPEKAGEKGQQ